MKFTESLKKTCQFRAVYGGGRSCADRLLVMYALANGSGQNKLGISVSRKVGNSVTRSRVTRLIREAYRLAEGLAAPGHDLVFVARANASGAGFEDIRQSVLALLKRQRLLREP
jgi:ribonuclease P protein component